MASGEWGHDSQGVKDGSHCVQALGQNLVTCTHYITGVSSSNSHSCPGSGDQEFQMTGKQAKAQKGQYQELGHSRTEFSYI